MAIKTMRRPELTFWEKLYIPQILSGLKITFSHFFRNLFLHIAHRVGRLRHVRAGVTYQYPEELRPLMSRFRSRHRLTVRDDGTPRCVGCMLCMGYRLYGLYGLPRSGRHDHLRVQSHIALGFS